jgi:asparagine synthase (glutamine-hydrolysing)
VSGFAGIVSLDGAPPDTRLLERMAERLAFRGPDGTHITTKPGAGFCFTFLRTGPAPQCPSQPCSLDGRVWLLGDVRLDGRDDLRRKLAQHGDEIAAGVTDEELVLRAWQRWREDAFSELIGDYSVGLWDAEARQLCCARDLMGARPFFYAQAGNRLYFSNTLNAVRCAPEISSVLDDHFIGDFLLQGSCADNGRTAFREIARLPAGHLLKYSNGELRIKRNTWLQLEEPLWLSRSEEYIEQFFSLLKQAVLDRLPDGGVAVLLSGGLDSTCIASMATRCMKEKPGSLSLRAYTFDCQPLFDDKEGILATRAASHLGIPIQVCYQSEWLPFAGFEDSQIMPEPSGEPYLALQREQNRRIALHARVVLTGYGGDGVLTGQAWPYLVYLLRARRWLRAAKDFGTYSLKHGRIPPLRAGFRATINRWVRRPDPMAGYPQWLAPKFEYDLVLRDRWLRLQQAPQKLHPFYPDAYETLGGGYWPGILESEEPAWHGTHVQSRSPLLDVRIQRFLLRVPPVPMCIDKELLRRAMDGMLPDEIRFRPKTPLAGDPVAQQLKNGSWAPRLGMPAQSTRQFVDWPRFTASLQNSPISYQSSELRAISLQYWLKGVEKEHGFQ